MNSGFQETYMIIIHTPRTQNFNTFTLLLIRRKINKYSPSRCKLYTFSSVSSLQFHLNCITKKHVRVNILHISRRYIRARGSPNQYRECDFPRFLWVYTVTQSKNSCNERSRELVQEKLLMTFYLHQRTFKTFTPRIR